MIHAVVLFMKLIGVQLIKNIYNKKSKEILIQKKVLDKIFKPIQADFFIEINVQTTSILKHLNKKTNNLIHFYSSEDAEILREVRDNLKGLLSEVKNFKIEKNNIENFSDRENLILNFLKNSQEIEKNNYKISMRKFKSETEKISNSLKDFFISQKNSLDIIKGFNEPNNVILIHLNPINYQSFFKIHGNFFIFHKAKILLIGNEINNNLNFFKKYDFKPLFKNLTKNTFWSKNF